MDTAAALRMLASLGLVLGLLAAALWAVRRFDLRLPGRTSERGRLQIVERLTIDPKRSLVLVRCDRSDHLLLLGPEGSQVVERAIAAPAPAAPDRTSPHGCTGPVPSAPTFASLLAAHTGRPRLVRPRPARMFADLPCLAD